SRPRLPCRAGRPAPLGSWRREADRGFGVSARASRGSTPARRGAQDDREGGPRPVTALVTGSAGGIGSASVRKLRAEGFEVQELDLVNGFDVTDPEAWEHIGSVDLACLNAGVITGESEIAALTDEQYRRAVRVNVDGVVYGVRRLDRVMPKGST